MDAEASLAGTFPTRDDAMPDLGHLQAGSLRLHLTALSAIGHEPVQTEPDRAYVFNLVRLSEKALNEYSAARSNFREFVHRGASIEHLMRCIYNLETCVNAAHRGFEFFEALRRDGVEPYGRSTMAELTRAQNVVRWLVDDLRTLRDAIEHRDDRLRGTRPAEDSASLLPRDSFLVIGGARLSYRELARAVEALF